MNLWRARVADALHPCIGEKLVSASIESFAYELDEALVNSESFYVAGEVWLRFARTSICVSWDENVGWPDHFSVYVGERSLFRKDHHVGWGRIEVGGLSCWAPYVGEALQSVRVFFSNETPHLVAFELGSDSIFIGVGSEEALLHGDDVLVRLGKGALQLDERTGRWRGLSSAA